MTKQFLSKPNKRTMSQDDGIYSSKNLKEMLKNEKSEPRQNYKQFVKSLQLRGNAKKPKNLKSSKNSR